MRLPPPETAVMLTVEQSKRGVEIWGNVILNEARDAALKKTCFSCRAGAGSPA
jgi:hypothetical protein